MRRWRIGFHCWMLVAGFTANHSAAWAGDHSEVMGIARGEGLSALVYADGTYAIAAPGASRPVIRSNVGAVVDAVDLSSAAYPHHVVERSEAGSTLTITHSGLVGKPDLVCVCVAAQAGSAVGRDHR